MTVLATFACAPAYAQGHDGHGKGSRTPQAQKTASPSGASENETVHTSVTPKTDGDGAPHAPVTTKKERRHGGERTTVTTTTAPQRARHAPVATKNERRHGGERTSVTTKTAPRGAPHAPVAAKKERRHGGERTSVTTKTAELRGRRSGKPEMEDHGRRHTGGRTETEEHQHRATTTAPTGAPSTPTTRTPRR